MDQVTSKRYIYVTHNIFSCEILIFKGHQTYLRKTIQTVVSKLLLSMPTMLLYLLLVPLYEGDLSFSHKILAWMSEQLASVTF